MSRIPTQKNKPKYNHDEKFRWVDSQWEKLMSQNQELKNLNTQLQKDLETCTGHYSKLYDEHKKLQEYLNIRGDNDE